MPLARQDNNNFKILDFTDHMELLPRVHTLIDDMGWFTESGITTTVAQVERVTDVSGEIQARERGGERNCVGSESARNENFNVPFFPLDRAIKASDIQNFRAYGEGNAPKTIQMEVMRVMARVKRFHAEIKERAMMAAIRGLSYAPGSTTYNYYTVWGLTQASCNIAFGTATTDPFDVIELNARGPIIDAAQDGADSYEIMVIASRTWFAAIIGHPLVEAAYQNFASELDPLRKRLSGNKNARIFTHKGVTIVEDISGYMPNNEAMILPVGIDGMFQTHFSPSDTAQGANQAGQDLYLWYKESDYHREQKVESESSFICTNSRPELCIRSVGTF